MTHKRAGLMFGLLACLPLVSTAFADAHSAAPPPDGSTVVRTLAFVTGNPLVRFTGSVHDFDVRLDMDDAVAYYTPVEPPVTVVTGGDDLRGGFDNASVEPRAGWPRFLQVG
jgi:hypothetical protein